MLRIFSSEEEANSGQFVSESAKSQRFRQKMGDLSLKGLLQKTRQRLGILELNMHVGEALSYEFFVELQVMLEVLSEKKLLSEERSSREELV